jgi:hypothetical protein
MSYIGQGLPADVFSGFTTDAFTGNGSDTTFTLSKAPFSEDGLIVVINNVIQRPTTNFTVSGTTLTIVGTAVADGDVIYAIHTSGAVPSTLASKVDVNGLSDGVVLDADGDTTISADTDDQIDIKIAGADDIKITANKFELLSGTSLDMDGLSTKVAAGDVIFQGGIVGNVTLTNGTNKLLEFSTESYDRGNNFASGAFTAPKDGVYMFHCAYRPNNFAFDRIITKVFKNDSDIGGTAISNTGEVSNTNAGEYPLVQVTNLLSLSANDTIKHYGYQNSGGDQTIFQQTLFVIRVGTFD